MVGVCLFGLLHYASVITNWFYWFLHVQVRKQVGMDARSMAIQLEASLTRKDLLDAFVPVWEKRLVNFLGKVESAKMTLRRCRSL